MAVRDGFVILLASFTLATGTRTNVAERKPAWMSSNLYDRHPGSRAVDGEKRANEDRFLAHTAIGQSSAWWKVDLQTLVQSAQVIVYFRTNFCTAEMYGQECTRNCSSRHCKVFSSTCDHITGTCPAGGCQNGWMGVDCTTACGSGKYGANCAKDCSSRQCMTFSSTCDRFSGACPAFRCKDGWTGVDCTTVCAFGTYGASCTRNCSSRHCKMSSSACDHISGACPDSECEAGWMGTDCTTECTSGYYGANCGKKCTLRNCKEDSNCDRMQGLCEGGCAAGYNGTDCTEECPSGRYGINCNKTCGHCTNNNTCHHVAGICAGGCEAGWRADLCQKPLLNCPGGRYGPGCTEFCSSRNCKTPSPVCDVTGSCTDGCREGWQNADCRIPCPSGTYGSNCSKSCDSRKCKTSPTTCDHESGACPTGCREGWIGGDCTQRCKPGTYGPDCSRCGYCDVTCNVEDGRCPGECLDGFTGDRCDVDVRDSVVKIGVIGGAIGMAVMLLVVGLFMCLLKRGRLKWIPSNGPEPKEGRKKGYIEEIPAHTPTPGLENPDYTELNDVSREREEKSPYDVILSQVYENNII